MTQTDKQALRQQFEIERQLAARLLKSSRAERPEILRHLYDELLRRAPRHPRLGSHDLRQNEEIRLRARLRLLQPWLRPMRVFLEFAPGDGRIASAMCQYARQAYAVDISDQMPTNADMPDNFKLIVYDGYHIDLPDNSVDLAFSYQVLEHIHPEDVLPHFELVQRLLRPGGCYVFATPHAFSGPHDVSRGFSRVPQGLHLKEWTYGELIPLLEQAGLNAWRICRRGRYRERNRTVQLLRNERFFSRWPLWLRQPCCRRYLAGIVMAACKPRPQ